MPHSPQHMVVLIGHSPEFARLMFNCGTITCSLTSAHSARSPLLPLRMTQPSVSGQEETWSGLFEWWNYAFVLLCVGNTFCNRDCQQEMLLASVPEIKVVRCLEASHFSPPRHSVSLGFWNPKMYELAHFFQKLNRKKGHVHQFKRPICPMAVHHDHRVEFDSGI